MRKLFITIVLLFSTVALVTAQDSPKLPPGFPDRSPNLDLLPGFKTPPKGYGEVSFYWWLGDTLTQERILWQLDQLKDKGITGLQINYCHTDKGGATYGLTYPSQPALFSAQWWKLFQWFLKEAKKRDMSVSLSDYTLGAAGQGWFVDEMLNENPGLHGAKLESKQFEVQGGQEFKANIPGVPISVTAFPNFNGTLHSAGSVNLTSMVKEGELTWKAAPGKWRIVVVFKNEVKTSFDPMNPLSGKKIVEKFYQRFEDHCPGESGKGLNFFFSDELQFGIRGFLWNDHFAAEFRKRKGYEILPELAGLFVDLGPRTYKTRLDYNDVMVSLSEDGFFKPVYNWHNSRGMLFGCDHGGRGRDVTEFGDYFRTQRWMSGPGCDQPGLGRDIVKNKVASSIAHMYERPRTWLEGFYGSGWGTSSEEVADATFANFAMGQNLLSLHGLYYSTYGSWWEWAAPENHWRQPYWNNMGAFLKCSERLSYVLSQGHHRCDVAMVYPVAPVEANLKGKEATETAFSIARDLYPAGIDFDFMDFESLNRCKTEDQELRVSGEKYRVLILPALSAVRYATIEKALQFFRAGGIVLAVGALPQASDRVGSEDEKLQSMVREMFGTTFSDKQDTSRFYTQKSSSGGTGIFVHNPMEVKKIIAGLFQPDFKPMTQQVVPGIMHRKIGNRDLYFVYGLPKNSSCFFRATGKVELWNPWSGATSGIKVSSVTKEGTVLQLPLDKTEPQLIVFSPGKPDVGSAAGSPLPKETLTLDGNWEFELKPTLDNKYGDYRMPAFNGKVGVEVWKMKFAEESSQTTGWQNPGYDYRNWETVSVSFGPQFWKLGPFAAGSELDQLDSKLAAMQQINPKKPVVIQGVEYWWKPYEFSWRWGLKGDAGHQGYHGMKGLVNNDLLSFGNLDVSRKHMPVYPLKPEIGGTIYYVWSSVSATGTMQTKLLKSGLLPEKIYLNHKIIASDAKLAELNSGSNPLLLRYNGTGRGYLLFEKTGPATSQAPSVPLSTAWYLKPSILPFNCNPRSGEVYGLYHYTAPPGATGMIMQTSTEPGIWVEGKEILFSEFPAPEQFADKDSPVWKARFPDVKSKSFGVTLRIKQLPGLFGGAAIPEPVLFECDKGMIQVGDLAENESLSTYSGSMWYRKTITINANQANSSRIDLNLGKVVATAGLYVNGIAVGTRISPPWTFDLTGKVKPGENMIEILIQNTLGNHYLTTPSQYVGRTSSGLIGPVTLEFR